MSYFDKMKKNLAAQANRERKGSGDKAEQVTPAKTKTARKTRQTNKNNKDEKKN